MTIIRKPTRAQLSRFIPDQQAILAFEQLFAAAAQVYPVLLTSTYADSTAIANTSSPVNFSQTYTLPADALTIGRAIRFTLRALYSTTGSPTYRLRVLLGTTPIIDTGTGVALITGATNRGLTVQGEITCQTIGATGTVVGGVVATSGTTVLDAIAASAVTVDTTASQTLTFEWTWSAASASNTIKLRQLLVEAMN